MGAIEIPEISARCSDSPIECVEVAPDYFDIRASDSARNITLSPTFTTGTATYSVNGGTAIALTSGTPSANIALNPGTSASSRVTKIVVTHTGAVTSTYNLRIFRMRLPTTFEIRDRDNPSNLYTHAETYDNPFVVQAVVNVPHGVTQLEKKLTGPGYFHYWSGQVEITNSSWVEMNWSACCRLRDGSNTNLGTDIRYFPFQQDPVLEGIGNGPSIQYQFNIIRATAFSQPPSSSVSSSSTSEPTSSSSSSTSVAPSSGGGIPGDSSNATLAPGEIAIPGETVNGETSNANAVPGPVLVATTTTTSTTLPPEIDSNGVSTEPAPTAPTATPGEGSATVNGETISLTISRENNQLIFVGAGIKGSIRGTKANGNPIPLDSEGDLRVEIGDKVSLTSEGFLSNSITGVWLFSTPQKVGNITADAFGKNAGTFTIEDGVELGNHRIVLQGINSDGDEVVIAVGIAAGAIDTTSTLSRVLIVLPISLAVFFGLFIPNQVRRRRRQRMTTF